MRLPVLQTYGLTESCSQATTEPPGSADATSAGTPLPHLELRIVDKAGAPLKTGGEGEIELRGGSVTSGYFDDPAATAAAFREGWFRTRDLGVLDARGRLRVLSRRTDLIVRGGENVYPAELEQVLERHPSVIEAAVIAEQHPGWGQVPVAIVALREATPDESLRAWCSERLARFKLPERFVRTESLPRNAMGKVDRRRLAALL
jgi:O-succinylbenzoic acid--CoA ligase